MSQISIDNSDTLGDLVIRISHAELTRLTMCMFAQRSGVAFDESDIAATAASVVARMTEVDEDTGFTAIQSFFAQLGCDHLVQDTTAPEQTDAFLAERAASNVVPIRPVDDDDVTQALLSEAIDEWFAEGNEKAA